MFSDTDIFWMQHAIVLAKSAAAHDEVPVGAVLVQNGQLIGEGWNRPVSNCDPSAHAEIIALRNAAKNLNNYRLPGSVLYVTLGPCMMCIGAIAHARVQRVVFGAEECRVGAVKEVLPGGTLERMNHHTIYEGGLLAEECGHLLSTFFRARRVDDRKN